MDWNPWTCFSAYQAYNTMEPETHAAMLSENLFSQQKLADAAYHRYGCMQRWRATMADFIVFAKSGGLNCWLDMPAVPVSSVSVVI